MLKELLDDIIVFLKTEVPEFENRVERYKNQFDKDSGYTFPNAGALCFIELLEATPMSRSADEKSLNKSYTFRALVGSGIAHSASDLAETVFDKLDSETTDIDGRTFYFLCEKIFLVGWLNNIQVYEVQFSAE